MSYLILTFFIPPRDLGSSSELLLAPWPRRVSRVPALRDEDGLSGSDEGVKVEACGERQGMVQSLTRKNSREEFARVRVEAKQRKDCMDAVRRRYGYQ